MAFRPSLNRLLVVATLAAPTLILSGCIVSGSRNTKISGDFIGEQTLAMIEPGKTDKSWVLGVMGVPTWKKDLADDNHEIWVWESSRTRHADTSVLLIFDGDKHVETFQRVYVEFQGDLVTRAWRDSTR